MINAGVSAAVTARSATAQMSAVHLPAPPGHAARTVAAGAVNVICPTISASLMCVFALRLVPASNVGLTAVKTNARTLALTTSTARRTCASAILPNAAGFAAPKNRSATPNRELAAIRSAPAASVARMAADMNAAVVTLTNCVSMENVSVSRIARELNAAQTVAAMCADIATSASAVTMEPVATCNATAGK